MKPDLIDKFTVEHVNPNNSPEYRHMTTEVQRSEYVYEHILYLSDARPQDFRDYVCIARSSVGTATAEAAIRKR